MRARHSLSVLVLGTVLLASASATAAGVDPTTATAQQKQQAQARFSRAHGLFMRGGFTQALNEATASWEIVASPNARIMIARCLRELGKPARAYAEYAGTIDDANALARKEARYAETAKAAASEQSGLEPQLALITVRVDHAGAGTQLVVAGQVVPQGAWSRPLPEDPGNVDVVVQNAGTEVARQSVTVAAGEKKTVDVDANPPPPPALAQGPGLGAESRDSEATGDAGSKGPSGREAFRTPAYILGGVGVAGFALFAIFGALDDSTYHGLQSACPGNACPPSKASDISTGRTQQTVANVGLGFGIAGIAAGATLFALSLGGKSEAPATALVVSPSFIGLRGAL